MKKFDDLLWQREIRRVYEDAYYPAATSAIRVYVYEMPAKFTYDLLWLFRNTYKETSNHTSNGSPVHRLIEQVWYCDWNLDLNSALAFPMAVSEQEQCILIQL